MKTHTGEKVLTTEETIARDCAAIAAVLEMEVSNDDPAGLAEKLHKLINICSLSATNVSRARAHWMEAKTFIIESVVTDTEMNKLPASVLTELVKAKAGRAESLYQLAERHDNKLGYAIEGMRSLVSLYKAELSNNLQSENTRR